MHPSWWVSPLLPQCNTLARPPSGHRIVSTPTSQTQLVCAVPEADALVSVLIPWAPRGGGARAPMWGTVGLQAVIRAHPSIELNWVKSDDQDQWLHRVSGGKLSRMSECGFDDDDWITCKRKEIPESGDVQRPAIVPKTIAPLVSKTVAPHRLSTISTKKRKTTVTTCVDNEGTVHELPSASRLATNKELYAESCVKNPFGYKPCGRCSFPCGNRSLKCQDKKNCQVSMIKPMTYNKGLSPEEVHDAAVKRIKADYEEKVDSVIIYADYEKESPFVDDRHLVLSHAFCCTCELNRLCSGRYHAPIGQPRFLSLTACRNCRRRSLVRRSRPKIHTADTKPAHQRNLVETRN